MKKESSSKSKAGGSAIRESFTWTMAFHIQAPVRQTMTKAQTNFDLVSRRRNFRSRMIPVIRFARAPSRAVRKDARALERTVK